MQSLVVVRKKPQSNVPPVLYIIFFYIEKVSKILYSRATPMVQGQRRWRSGLAPPATQGVILETLDRVPRQALCMEPAFPSACVSDSLSLPLSLSLSVCVSMNKVLKK